MKPPPNRVHRNGGQKPITNSGNQRGKTLTLRVSRNQRSLRTHASLYKSLANNQSLFNRRIKV
jgi:hypothetical protein